MVDQQDQGTKYLGEIDVKATLLAAVIAAAASLLVLVVLLPIVGVNVWEPFFMMAAVLLGPEALAAPRGFHLGVVAAAVVVHLGLSVIYTFVLAGMIHNQSSTVGVVMGIGFGLLLYIINFYFFTGLFPWFEMGRNWLGVLAHLTFGLAAGWVYVRSEIVSPKRQFPEHQHA